MLALALLGTAAAGTPGRRSVSVATVAGFAGAFGFGGASSRRLPAGLIVGAVAAASRAVPAGVGTRLGRAARDMRTDATPTRDDLVGALGLVVTPIP